MRLREVVGALFAAVTISPACAPPPAARPRPTEDQSLLQPSAISDASRASHPGDPASLHADAGIVTQPAVDASACPPEMALVDGLYCPKVSQPCARWMPDGVFSGYRCAEYEKPARCLSEAREKRRFCIDREEYVKEGDALPLVNQSWTTAGAICRSRGARMCLESEWQFACEGEEMRPYPYGFVRDATACNIDRTNLADGAHLRDLRAPVSEFPRCVSAFGVHDMSGNIEEWATIDGASAPHRATMKGAWWLPGKNNCRAATLEHGEEYAGGQIGVRCCRDARGAGSQMAP